jgi:hypothetical protein
MISTRTLPCFSLALSLVAAGCGSSDSTTTPPADSTPADTGSSADSTKTDGADSTTDSAADTTTPEDTTPSGDTGIACGSSTCSGGDVCCATPKEGGVDFACAKACADGGVTIACDGPAGCSSSAKYCCGTLDVGAGSPPLCPLNAAGAACKASCDTSFPMSCPGKGQVRLCKKRSDCADDTSNPNCCTVSTGGTTATFCASDIIKSLAGTAATCL